MLKPLVRLVAFTIIIGLLLRASLFAHSIVSSQSLPSQLAVRRADRDPNYPTAEGLHVLAPAENRLKLLENGVGYCARKYSLTVEKQGTSFSSSKFAPY